MAKTKLLIIGASSLVGRRLREAVAGDERFKACFTTRKPKHPDDLFLDLLRPEDFFGQGFEHVIITSPIWLITDEVLEVLWGQGAKRIVAFSSTSRFSKTFSPEPEERRVAELLARSEGKLVAFTATHDMTFTILRPTLIYDEGHDDNISRIAAFVDRRGFFPVCDGAKGMRQPVHARDLARAALRAVVSEAAADKAYDLSGGETLSYHDMVARVFAAKGKRPRIISLPKWLWQTGFWLKNTLSPPSALKTNINMALRMNTDMVFDHSEATQDFGYAPDGFRPYFLKQIEIALMGS
ncbi:SDR family oxidoreductase [Asticcacaulis tiandongensis]|uniref:SDR family oxidoreductase n=1 Tax=Asticcacaulis tiandongensis TaxID=2565365 RepID=UPI00112CE55D|nr:epimerase [Asticcacaulis tiandongensis]